MSKKKDNNKDSGYKNWLKESDLEDTEENRDWYNTPINKKSEYIENHKKWWEKL